MKPLSTKTWAGRLGIALVMICVLLGTATLTFYASLALKGSGSPAPSEIGTVSPTVSSATLSSTASYSSTSTSLSPTSSTTTETLVTSTNSSTTCVPSIKTSCTVQPLGIFEEFIDVYGPADNRLATNETTFYNGDDIYVGETFSTTLSLIVNVGYATCVACPTILANVTAGTPGFKVTSTSPAAPFTGATTAGDGNGTVEFMFSVYVQTPATPYNGPLTIDVYTCYAASYNTTSCFYPGHD